MDNPLYGHDYFPPEFVSPSFKEQNSYGLQYAKAIYNCDTRYGMRYWNSYSDFDALTDLAQGKESITDLQKAFGYYIKPGNRAEDDPTAQLAYMDIKTLSLAPKYINRAVAKMQKIDFDYGLEAVDIVSIKEKEDYIASLGAFYRMRKWVEDMKYDPRVMFPEIDVDSLPQYPDEMLYDISVNPKIKQEISGELLIQLLHEANNYPQKVRQADWDLCVYGRAHLYNYHDANGIPRLKRINPKYWFGSYVENDDFEEQEYAGFFDHISVNQFIKETAGQISQDQQMEIVAKWAGRGPVDGFTDYRRIDQYDGLSYIPVMRFYFRSEDVRTYVKKPNFMGDKILVEKAYNYLPPREVAHRFNENGDSKIIRNQYTSIYGGTWVLESDVVYNYGRKNYPRQNLVDASLPIKTFGTNQKEGRVVSFLTQMIEPISMVNTAWNKIKQILAEGRTGIMEIDFDQIEEVAIAGKGGQAWTGLDVMKFLFKKNILLKRGKVNRYDQKVGNAIEFSDPGVKLPEYFQAFTTGIQMLESLTGTSLLEGMDIPDRTTAKSAEISQATSNVDLEYLYNGHEYLTKKSTQHMLLLGQQSLADGYVIQGFIPALGKVSTGYYNAPQELAYCEFGMFPTRKPTPEEWALWYQDISIALKEGRISAADSAYVREITNMKQARQILALRENMYQRRVRQEAQDAAQLQMQANEQQAIMSLEAERAKIQEQLAADKELAILNGKIQQMLQQEKIQGTLTQTSITEQSKRNISKQKSSDEIVKQAVRNIPEKTQAAAKLADVRVKAEGVKVDLEKVKVDAKKPVPKKT